MENNRGKTRIVGKVVIEIISRFCKLLILFGWGTRSRTSIHGVRVRCPTIERSPNFLPISVTCITAHDHCQVTVSSHSLLKDKIALLEEADRVNKEQIANLEQQLEIQKKLTEIAENLDAYAN